MAFSAKQLHDRYVAAVAGKRAVGDPALPELSKQPVAVREAWDSVAHLVNAPKPEVKS